MTTDINFTEDFDFRTLINNSRKIKIKNFTLVSLMKVLGELKCSKKVIYEILFTCSTSKVSIFRNITPISIPDQPAQDSET